MLTARRKGPAPAIRRAMLPLLAALACAGPPPGEATVPRHEVTATRTALITPPAVRKVRLAIILSKFLDKPIQTRPPSFYEDFYVKAGTDGLSDYWSDVTFGAVDLTGSQVFGWLTMSHNSSEVGSLVFPHERWKLVQWGRDAAAANLIDLSTFDGVVVVHNYGVDHGAAHNGIVIVDQNAAFVETTFIAHEMGHLLGLGHSYGENVWPCITPHGEYCDAWDIMSAMNVFSYGSSFAGVPGSFGPGLNVFDLKRLGGMPGGGAFSLAHPDFSETVQLAPLNQPLKTAGSYAVEIPRPGGTLFTAEYHHKAGWDQGVPADAVVIHEEKLGRSYLQPTVNNSSLVAGQRYNTPDPKVYLQVASIDSGLQQANVRAWDLPEGSLRREDSDPKVYLVENGKKRWVTSPAALFGLGRGWADVRVVPDGGLSDLPEGRPVPHEVEPWAVVNEAGVLIRSGAALGATRLGPGRYEVKFDRPVDGCGYTATIGDPASGLVYHPGMVFTAGGHTSTSHVYVETKNPGGGLQDYPFHLAVSCERDAPWAVVNEKGGAVRGGLVASVSQLGAGRYEVTFTRDVSGCGYTATIGDPANGLVYHPGMIFTAGGHGGPSGVYVETKNPGGGLRSYPFHLTVSCGLARPWAVVGLEGNLVRGGSILSANRLGPGRFEVEFARDVSGCGYTATIGDPSNKLVYNPGLVFTAGGHTGPQHVYLETKNFGGGLQDFPFHLNVSCWNPSPIDR